MEQLRSVFDASFFAQVGCIVKVWKKDKRDYGLDVARIGKNVCCSLKRVLMLEVKRDFGIFVKQLFFSNPEKPQPLFLTL